MSFGKGFNIMEKIRKCGIATVRIIQVKVVNSLVSDETRVDLDIHDDTIVLGKKCMEIYNWNFPVKLSGWYPKDREKLCQTIPGAVAYDYPQNGQVGLLIFHKCIYVEHLDHHILCTM